MNDLTVGGINDCFPTAGEERLPHWGFDDSLVALNDFRFDFHEWKCQSKDKCISAIAGYFSLPQAGHLLLHCAEHIWSRNSTSEHFDF
jgi:hypothetical protein